MKFRPYLYPVLLGVCLGFLLVVSLLLVGSNLRLKALEETYDSSAWQIMSRETSILVSEAGSIVLFTEVPMETCPTGDPLALIFIKGHEDAPVSGCWHARRGLIIILWEINETTLHSASKFREYTAPIPTSPTRAKPPLTGPIALLS